MNVPSDLEIAQRVTPKPIDEIARFMGIDPQKIEKYGNYKAKLPLSLLEEKHRGKLVLVTAMNPTPMGEGKTTVSIGLSMALNRRKKKSVVALREPSLGPVFGVKGGATGGGFAQVIPMEDINLHFTGDFHAVASAHNLLSAMIDNHAHHRLEPQLDLRTILWPRTVDMNDRALRGVVVGLGGRSNGFPREDSFVIVPASEVMAILGLSLSYSDLKRRLGNVLVGFTPFKEPVFAKDIKAEGAMAVLLRDALKPNLVQTLEHTPALIHTGPFANIAHGTNSIVSTLMALAYSEVAVVEAGFGADLGAEKFLDLVAPTGGFKPSVAVIVATVRALKYHGGVSKRDVKLPNPDAVVKGFPNLQKHIENMQKYGLPVVVAVNRFANDTEDELRVLEELLDREKVRYAAVEVWAKGSEGGLGLADAVLEALQEKTDYRPIYDWDMPIKDKIERIAREIYGADGVLYYPKAERDIKRYEKLGYGSLPICMAKTQYSLSDDPKKLGRPKGFKITVREVRLLSGAGFLVPITGDIMTMPGLPKEPAAVRMDLDEKGRIYGLF
ncbi:MAG: formate--tetrahydrofolate ligase [Thermotogae bacterium]|nr:formate--tetrahydrofolate ligase [Thermotogota bacterium]